MRDFPPRREATGHPCAAISCEVEATVVAMAHARVPGEFGKQDDFTHVHFEIPVCEDHALLFRNQQRGFGQLVSFETMRE